MLPNVRKKKCTQYGYFCFSLTFNVPPDNKDNKDPYSYFDKCSVNMCPYKVEQLTIKICFIMLLFAIRPAKFRLYTGSPPHRKGLQGGHNGTHGNTLSINIMCTYPIYLSFFKA